MLALGWVQGRGLGERALKGWLAKRRESLAQFDLAHRRVKATDKDGGVGHVCVWVYISLR